MKKIISLFLTLVVLVMLSSCGKKKLTIQSFLNLKTQEDVINLLGQSKDADMSDYTFYDDVSLSVNGQKDQYKFSLMIHYNNDNSIDDLSLSYHFNGEQNIESVANMLEYEPTTDDIFIAQELAKCLIDELTTVYGEPEVYNSQINTISYTWNINRLKFSLEVCYENVEYSIVFGALEVSVYFNT